MKIKLKQYKYEKVEIGSLEVNLPTKTEYYFQTGVRRSIRIVPIFTTWNKERFNKEEELYRLDFTLLYNSFECKLEKISIHVSDLEEIYYNVSDKNHSLISGLVDGYFQIREEEDFKKDLDNILTQLTLRTNMSDVEDYFGRISNEIFNNLDTMEDLIKLMRVSGYVDEKEKEKFLIKNLDNYKIYLKEILPNFSLEEILKIDKNFQQLKGIYNSPESYNLLSLIEYELRKKNIK